MKFKPRGFLIFIVFVVSLIFFGNFMAKRAERLALEYEIGGIIKYIEYDQKRVPTILVDGNEYYLYRFGIRKSSELEIGDSIYKRRNGRFFKHYKKYPNGFYLKETYSLK